MLMSENFVQIDVSKYKSNKREDDLIKIRLKGNDVINVHFSKLISLSKYIRDKYKYSEALSMMQKEIEDIIKEKKVSTDSLKHFFELVEEEKVNIQIKEYRNLYTLSEYFDIPIFIKELDLIIQEQEQVKIKTEEEKKQQSLIVTVGGYDEFNQLGKSPNNENKHIISPPLNFQLDPSPLLSFSNYGYHSVLITSEFLLKGIGSNRSGEIIPSLGKKVFDHFTDFCIKDSSDRYLDPVSAICTGNGTLYLFPQIRGSGKQLLLCDNYINNKKPVFLDIGNHHPVALFGGQSFSAAIGSEGEIIFINRYSVAKSPKSFIPSVSLPDGEKASSIACCEDSVVVLSSNGRVFSSPVDLGGAIVFSEVDELAGKEIICVSGTFRHVFAVSKEGRVFGRGFNQMGQLGLGEEISEVSSFVEISSLVGYEIRAAYAGASHSLFETREGKILSCGYNEYGQLLLSSGESTDVCYSPTETTITSNATFCIAGMNSSIVFIGVDAPPNTPNKRITIFEQQQYLLHLISI